ncbi:MAG: hypothetical protein ABJH04_14860 [Cyclobacteriaceae bacterium]
MKLTYKLLILFLVVLAACGKPSTQTEEEENQEVDADPNQSLYDMVMDVHDEVMPKMDDIYKIKSQLQEKIVNSPDLVQERKDALEKMILSLDSANNSMMVWMRQFNRPADSLDVEEARAYLESQMEKINAVKETMLSTLEEAKAEAEKN